MLTTKRGMALLMGSMAALGALVLVACGGGETELVAQPTPSLPSPTVAASATPTPVPSPSPTATPQPSPTVPATPATSKPCPPSPYYLTPSVGALGANLADAIGRWNAWLGCSAFAIDPTASRPGVIRVDFAPAEIEDRGWAQFSGGTVYLAPPTTPARTTMQPYANDYNMLTCVILHGLGHILGYQDDAAGAPLIMRPLAWPSWPPTSCPTPNSF
jgi:hypothetical protein